MQEKKFVPKPGQTDYSNIRYAPVINCVLKHDDKILLVQRSSGMRLYPGFWNGVSGFLDDDRSIEDKVREELREELGIDEEYIQSITLKHIFLQDAPEYKKTWIVHPLLVEVSTDIVTLDWEAQGYEWVKPEDAKAFDLMPGFELVLERIFGTGDGSWSMSRGAKKLSQIL